MLISLSLCGCCWSHGFPPRVLHYEFPVLQNVKQRTPSNGNNHPMVGNEEQYVWSPSLFYHIWLHTASNILVEEQSWGKFYPICREAWCSGDRSGGEVSKQDNEEMLLQGPCTGGVQVGTVGAGFQQDQHSHEADALPSDPAHTKTSYWEEGRFLTGCPCKFAIGWVIFRTYFLQRQLRWCLRVVSNVSGYKTAHVPAEMCHPSVFCHRGSRQVMGQLWRRFGYWCCRMVQLSQSNSPGQYLFNGQ